jgi:hypothetical protein
MTRYIAPLIVGVCVGGVFGYVVSPKPYDAIFTWIVGLLT